MKSKKILILGGDSKIGNALYLDLKNSFSMILVDEAHLCPADMFSTALNGLNAKIKIGISATPKRKDGKHKKDVARLRRSYYFQKNVFISSWHDTNETCFKGAVNFFQQKDLFF